MHDFFECICNVCLNDLFLFYEKIHLWNFRLFVFKKAFIYDIFRCAQSIIYLTVQNYIVNRLNKEFSFSTSRTNQICEKFLKVQFTPLLNSV